MSFPEAVANWLCISIQRLMGYYVREQADYTRVTRLYGHFKALLSSRAVSTHWVHTLARVEVWQMLSNRLAPHTSLRA